MREIVLDTETTGLEPAEGHRLVELGCIELFNHLPTGSELHFYVNPERDIPEDAIRIHNLSAGFLGKQPRFADIAASFVEFIADSPLVIHNAEFDLKFLNAELARAGLALLAPARAIDTLLLARRKFPGSPASLDALCKRFGVDLSVREAHGALVDARLLACVYLELIGGRQPGLNLAGDLPAAAEIVTRALEHKRQPARETAQVSLLTNEELEAHRAFVAALKGEAIWKS